MKRSCYGSKPTNTVDHVIFISVPDVKLSSNHKRLLLKVACLHVLQSVWPQNLLLLLLLMMRPALHPSKQQELSSFGCTKFLY
jgi:hypothetical protein